MLAHDAWCAWLSRVVFTRFAAVNKMRQLKMPASLRGERELGPGDARGGTCTEIPQLRGRRGALRDHARWAGNASSAAPLLGGVDPGGGVHDPVRPPTACARQRTEALLRVALMRHRAEPRRRSQVVRELEKCECWRSVSDPGGASLCNASHDTWWGERDARRGNCGVSLMLVATSGVAVPRRIPC